MLPGPFTANYQTNPTPSQETLRLGRDHSQPAHSQLAVPESYLGDNGFRTKSATHEYPLRRGVALPPIRKHSQDTLRLAGSLFTAFSQPNGGSCEH